jgi:hypothetical protein
MKITIGIDNGCSGTIGIIGPDGTIFETMPSKDELQGRAGKVIKRVDWEALRHLLLPYFDCGTRQIRVHIERPFTGKFLNAVLPGQRSYEAVLVVTEMLGFSRQTVDSRDWQKALLPGVTGSPELKRASMLLGIQLYPQFADQIKKHGDADGLLIAHHFHHSP